MAKFDKLRRQLVQAMVAGPATWWTARAGAAEPAAAAADDGRDTFDYVIVGSGAGGAPLAANLARQGHSVLVLEAGEDRGTSATYQVPAFHPFSTEDPAMRWDFYVNHYGDPVRAARDSKLVYENRPDGTRAARGVLYPRAATIGGCTAHNAMITVYPHESDWNHIAALTGDTSWRADAMRRYFGYVERADYLGKTADPERTHGWLAVGQADGDIALKDRKLLHIVKAAAFTVGRNLFDDLVQLVGLMRRDLNAPGAERDNRESVYIIPQAVDPNGRRSGPRDYLLAARNQHPDRLIIRTNALATRVLFAEAADREGNQRAIGVEYQSGRSLYRADPRADAAPGEPTTRRAFARREVILCGGAFNTPQLLKLSGIGPRAELERFGIRVRVDSPGVGTNLQDRYEVGVISKAADDFDALEACTFGRTGTDPCLAEWARRGTGPYSSNGTVVGITRRSTPDKPDPDLFIFGAPSAFKGYEPGYAWRAVADKRSFTWAVLKAHTGNRAGTVGLRSADPRDVPEINFRYFDEGTPSAAAADLDAVVRGVEFVRAIGRETDRLGTRMTEVWPGAGVVDRSQLAAFVANEAWGHHASCTCPIGPDGDPNAVLDSRFRVRGASGLRVVDASVFPRIPGFFIVVPVYMVSEKATDALLEDIGERRRFSGSILPA